MRIIIVIWIFLIGLVGCKAGVTETNLELTEVKNSEARVYKTVGVESEASMVQNAKWYNPKTAQKISIRWSDVEQEQGIYDWRIPDKKLDGYYADWISIKMTPDWAGASICELPRDEYWADAAQFYQAVIHRYNPKFLEIWNEPNAKQSLSQDNYGCIGDGQSYGRFVKYVYDHVDGADIILGAVSSIYDEPFVSDMLKTVGDNFDGLSFHCYVFLYDTISNNCQEEYAYAESLINKPVYISETAVIHKEGDEPAFVTAQIIHYQNMKKIPTLWFWYTCGCNNWPTPYSSDLVYEDKTSGECVPRPVWYIYKYWDD